MKESAKKYRHLLEFSQDLLVTLNLQGIIIDTNEAAITLTGVERDALLGADFLLFFRPVVDAGSLPTASDPGDGS